jgi:disulfide bond formation protein DsbB
LRQAKRKPGALSCSRCDRGVVIPAAFVIVVIGFIIIINNMNFIIIIIIIIIIISISIIIIIALTISSANSFHPLSSASGGALQRHFPPPTHPAAAKLKLQTSTCKQNMQLARKICDSWQRCVNHGPCLNET